MAKLLVEQLESAYVVSTPRLGLSQLTFKKGSMGFDVLASVQQCEQIMYNGVLLSFIGIAIRAIPQHIGYPLLAYQFRPLLIYMLFSSPILLFTENRNCYVLDSGNDGMFEVLIEGMNIITKIEILGEH